MLDAGIRVRIRPCWIGKGNGQTVNQLRHCLDSFCNVRILSPSVDPTLLRLQSKADCQVAAVRQSLWRFDRYPGHGWGPICVTTAGAVDLNLVALMFDVVFDGFFVHAYAAHEVARRPNNVFSPVKFFEPTITSFVDATPIGFSAYPSPEQCCILEELPYYLILNLQNRGSK